MALVDGGSTLTLLLRTHSIEQFTCRNLPVFGRRIFDVLEETPCGTTTYGMSPGSVLTVLQGPRGIKVTLALTVLQALTVSQALTVLQVPRGIKVTQVLKVSGAIRD